MERETDQAYSFSPWELTADTSLIGPLTHDGILHTLLSVCVCLHNDKRMHRRCFNVIYLQCVGGSTAAPACVSVYVYAHLSVIYPCVRI